MTVPYATGFQTNPNKDFLRSNIDRPLVREWFESVGTPLHYLGLPGPEMLDVVDWQPFLGNFTTIERGQNEQHLIFLRANVRDIEHRLHSLYGEFDNILLTGRDTYDHKPRWPYDIVNLDFYGGLIYKTLSRPKALKKLIENQSAFGRSFLFMVTCHVRDTDLMGEKDSFMGELTAKINRDFSALKTIREWSSWYATETTRDTPRQALYLNALFHEEGELAQFKVECRPPILYSGTGGSWMLHWMTTFRHQGGARRALSDQSLVDVVNLGYRQLADGRLFEPEPMPRLR